MDAAAIATDRLRSALAKLAAKWDAVARDPRQPLSKRAALGQAADELRQVLEENEERAR
jgi:hypothetical protein